MKSRREFLKLTAAGSLSMMMFGPLAAKANAAADKKSFGVGLQLYTIRDAMSADVPGTLKKVSDIGYKNLELAGYSGGKFYGYKPSEFKKMVDDLGMTTLSSHTQVEAAGITVENAKIMADAHAELGVKYCIQPWVEEVDRKIEKYKKMVGDWK
jgi:sugar phosphate isomerase/epimerase